MVLALDRPAVRRLYVIRALHCSPLLSCRAATVLARLDLTSDVPRRCCAKVAVAQDTLCIAATSCRLFIKIAAFCNGHLTVIACLLKHAKVIFLVCI